MYKFRNLLFVLLILLNVFSCKEDSIDEDQTIYTAEQLKVIKVNKFVNDAMLDAYLWYDKIPVLVKYEEETNSKAYFDKILYKEFDRWSFITDDYDGLVNSFAGKEKSFGWSLAVGKFSNSDNLFAFIEYVNPTDSKGIETPAAVAGLKRGDIIMGINGFDLDASNYLDLFYGDVIKISMGTLTNGVLSKDETKKYDLTSKELEIDPVMISKLIEKGDKKIAYMFYTGYVNNFDASLDKAFANFKAAGVTDLVIDLRYNGGGAVLSAIHLCSMIAPVADVDAQAILIKQQWNDKYQKYFIDEGRELVSRFDNNVTTKLSLNKVYVLTDRGTASASELTMVALQAYMDVIQIGRTTHGKYVASSTFRVKSKVGDSWVVEEDIKNWAIQPIIYKFSNSKGVTDFKDGFTPEPANVIDVSTQFEGVLGDENEAMLSRAIEIITGYPSTSTPMRVSQMKNMPSFKIIKRGASKYDKYKNTVLVDFEFLK